MIVWLVAKIPRSNTKTTSIPKILVQLPPLIDTVVALAAKTTDVESILEKQSHLAAVFSDVNTHKESLPALTEALRAELVRKGEQIMKRAFSF
jgi:hypothetical protein